jgi:hypothetical protein
MNDAKPSRRGIPRHHRLERRFNYGVAVYHYEVMVTGSAGNGPRLSYEVFVNGERKRRFLFIDLGEKNKDLALAWAEGYASALAGLATTKDEPET